MRYHGSRGPIVSLLLFGAAEKHSSTLWDFQSDPNSITMGEIDEKLDLEASYERKDAGVEYLSGEDVDMGSVDEVKCAKELQNKIPIFRQLRAGEEWLDRKMGVELQGIDRIPEEKKKPPSIWNVRPLTKKLMLKLETRTLTSGTRSSSCGGPSTSSM